MNIECDLEKDLGLDCLDKVEVMIALEEEFGVEIPEEIADSSHKLSEIAEFFKKRESHAH